VAGIACLLGIDASKDVVDGGDTCRCIDVDTVDFVAAIVTGFNYHNVRVSDLYRGGKDGDSAFIAESCRKCLAY